MDRIERAPAWARPMLNGALLVFVATGAKAGIVGPIAVGILLWRSPHPLLTLLQVLGGLVAVLLGGAMSGAVFAWVGRPLLRRGGAAAHLGSYATLAPYMLVGCGLLLAGTGELPSLEEALVVAAAGAVALVLFGSFVLRGLFIDFAGGVAPSSRQTTSRKRRRRARTG